MATRAAAVAAAAARIGCTPAEYAAHVAAGERWCSACRRWQPEEAHSIERDRSTGRRAYCRGCHAAKQRVWQRRMRERRAA